MSGQRSEVKYPPLLLLLLFLFFLLTTCCFAPPSSKQRTLSTEQTKSSICCLPSEVGHGPGLRPPCCDVSPARPWLGTQEQWELPAETERGPLRDGRKTECVWRRHPTRTFCVPLREQWVTGRTPTGQNLSALLQTNKPG